MRERKGIMIPFKPIRRSRISDKVAEELKRSIVVGRFKRGEKLPSERALAEAFQVSRVAIHEALRVMEISGFIARRRGAMGGSYVTDLTLEHSINAFEDLFKAGKISIEEIHGVRSVVEAEIARLAALNITADYARKLRDSLAHEEASPESLSEDMARKMALHLILAEACGNRFLETLEKSLMGLIKIAVETMYSEAHGDFDLFKLHPPDMHRPIVDAVVAGDASAAAAASSEHAFAYGENLRRAERAFRRGKRFHTLPDREEPAALVQR
jgi:GntR family transcriptional regulator, transcriptional repressor for pyruvate dehydrogenase complex